MEEKGKTGTKGKISFPKGKGNGEKGAGKGGKNYTKGYNHGKGTETPTSSYVSGSGYMDALGRRIPSPYKGNGKN